MSNVWIRTWTEVNIKEVGNHLLVVGELAGDCGKCKEIGLDYKTVEKCPHCGTQFKFISARFAKGEHEKFAVIKRIKERRGDLVFVDFDDYKKLTSKSKAEEFLRGE